jgi:hypothetical protein
MVEKLKILGIAGSLRKASYNRAALRAAQKLAPADATMELFELDGIPAFNQDEEKNPPRKVIELKSKVRAADAIHAPDRGVAFPLSCRVTRASHDAAHFWFYTTLDRRPHASQ